jgi:hypothetical protein
MLIHSILLRGANHLKFWPEFALDSTTSRSLGSTALESRTASLLQEPDIITVWPALALGTSLTLCRIIPRPRFSASYSVPIAKVYPP